MPAATTAIASSATSPDGPTNAPGAEGPKFDRCSTGVPPDCGPAVDEKRRSSGNLVTISAHPRGPWKQNLSGAFFMPPGRGIPGPARKLLPAVHRPKRENYGTGNTASLGVRISKSSNDK